MTAALILCRLVCTQPLLVALFVPACGLAKLSLHRGRLCDLRLVLVLRLLKRLLELLDAACAAVLFRDECQQVAVEASDRDRLLDVGRARCAAARHRFRSTGLWFHDVRHRRVKNTPRAAKKLAAWLV
eukprot:scaffold69669_cov65-Phaeocystis_antarctica.AAC.2